jgi:predicted RNase H-like HicB family nuclease
MREELLPVRCGTVLESRSICETNREIRKGKAEMEKFMAVFERGEDGWWAASCLEVPEAITQGKTIEEVRENLKDAIHLVLVVRREDAEEELEGRDDPGAHRGLKRGELLRHLKRHG